MRTVHTLALHLRRPWQRTILFTLCMLSTPFALAALLGGGSTAMLLPPAITLLLLGGALAAGRRDRRRPGGSVALTSSGIDVGLPGRAEMLAIARSEVVAGYEVPRDRSVELQLTGRRKLVVETSEPAALLAHLGQAVGQNALTMPLRGTIGAFVLGLLTFMLGAPTSSFIIGAAAHGHALPAVLPPIFCLVSTIAAVVLMVRRFGHPKVVVGADGVRVRGTLAQPFVPYGAIGHVTPHPMGVQIQLRNGQFVQLETYGQSEAQISALAARIEQGRAACVPEGTKLDALVRGQRSLQAWQDDIRRIALAPPGFRDQAYSRDDFERIVADASSPPEQRVGAALALRVADPGARPRIRIAAAASANDGLRAALEACASEDEAIDDDVLERATAVRR